MKENHNLIVNYKKFILLFNVILNAIDIDRHTLLLQQVLRFQKLLFDFHQNSQNRIMNAVKFLQKGADNHLILKKLP